MTIPIHSAFEDLEEEDSKSGAKGGQKGGQKRVGEKVGENLTENQRNILKAINDNPAISAREIARIIGISDRKAETNIAKLKRMGLLTRIGPAKGGYWKVTDQ